MSESFDQPRTIRFGKYIFSDDVFDSLVRSQLAPKEVLTISEFRHQYPESSRLVQVEDPLRVDRFCFDSGQRRRTVSSQPLAGERNS